MNTLKIYFHSLFCSVSSFSKQGLSSNFIVGDELMKTMPDFKCDLCKVFLFDQNGVDEHVKSLEHLQRYEVRGSLHYKEVEFA